MAPTANQKPPFDATAVRLRYNVVPDDLDLVPRYLQAVKVLLSADGDMAPHERESFARGMDMLGIAPEIRAQVTAFDPRSATVAELLPGMKSGGGFARMLVRDVAESTGGHGAYAAEEKQAVARVAEQLGVDPVTLRSIEALVDLEQAVHRLRSAHFPIQE